MIWGIAQEKNFWFRHLDYYNNPLRQVVSGNWKPCPHNLILLFSIHYKPILNIKHNMQLSIKMFKCWNLKNWSGQKHCKNCFHSWRDLPFWLEANWTSITAIKTMKMNLIMLQFHNVFNVKYTLFWKCCFTLDDSNITGWLW